MIVDIVMPKMGESINEGTILEWRKKIGDSVELDEILLEIGTDKVDSEIPSSSSGIVTDILFKPNDVVEVGTVIAKINTDQKSEVIITNKKELTSIENDADKEKNEYITHNKKKSDKPSNKFYSPVVMKIVAEKNISIEELKNVPSSGRGGRVTKKDILLYLDKKQPDFKSIKQPIVKIDKVSSPEIDGNKITNTVSQNEVISNSGQVKEMSHMRKLISKHMKKSIETSAHVYLMTEIDMTHIVDYIKLKDKEFHDKEGFSLTYTPFIVQATIKALEEYPQMNTSLSKDTIHYHKNINIGMAVSTDEGLMVPSIQNCEEKSFLGICRSVSSIAKRTRENSISADELAGSTFSITNFGVFGISMGTPIINQPNVGILGIGAIKKRTVVVESGGNDSIAIRSIMVTTLGFDHRLIDGSGGSLFLNSFQKNIESMDLKGLL
ncbi:MAG: dihydrolipoamide acetyltransferase family protein [Candidatus Neomarinimicrobiota bacterium]